MRYLLMLLLAWLPTASAHAADRDAETRMAAMAASAPLVREALADVRAAASGLRDPLLRRASLTALFDPDACARHRVGLDRDRQRSVAEALRARGWVDASQPIDAVMQGLFPPVRGGGACPRLPVADLLAPGGNDGSHHGWPGGLALHVAFNVASARALVRLYARPSGATGPDEERVVAAALWHDWAKALVLQWLPDGRLTPELQVAGTGAHHILGLAEAMRRGFPPAQVVVQACAHGVEPARLAGWIGAAALIAGVDAARYPVHITPECLIHHMSDQNWVFADAAVAEADRLLAAAAPRFGFADADKARYRFCYRNVALAHLGADRLFIASATERDLLLRALFRRRSRCR